MLEGKTIFITGGGSGLGAQICMVLAAAQANVVVADVNHGAAVATVERITTSGGTAEPMELDVRNGAAVDHALRQASRRSGHLDAVINSAAIDVTLPVDELSGTEWERVLATNLTGPFLVAHHAVAQMKRQGHGHIVNIASTASKRAWPNASVYHASKWGLLGLSHALHAELRPHGIKVTAVIAGGMRTPFLLDRFPDIDTGTLQDPVNVAQTVKFVLTQPAETVIPEIMVLPMRETSWP
ncbi:MAG: family oxidoreductase [Bradyrhizobium sp.]|nr:family oxidoreductase [Bradyrhizobium sp.]